MHITFNQLWQVFRMYTTRWELWLWISLWFFYFLIMGFGSDSSPRRLEGIFFMSWFPSVMLGTTVGTNLKQQFANPRARLLPNFTLAHLIIPGVMIAILIMIDAIVFVHGNDVSLVAMAGFILIMFISGIFASYLYPSIYAWLSQIPILVIGLNPKYMSVLILSGGPTISGMLLCIGLCELKALVARLMNLNEEMYEYSFKAPSTYWGLCSGAAKRERQQWEAQNIAHSRIRGWLCDVIFRIVFNCLPNRGLFRRILLWQLAGNFYALLLALVQFALVLLLFSPKSWNKSPIGFDEYFLSFFLIMLITAFLAGIWLRRWRYLSRESLYPSERSNFVHCFFSNFTLDMMTIAIGFCAGIIVKIAIFNPHVLFSGFVFIYIAMILALFVMETCLMIWLIPVRDFFCLLFGYMAMVLVWTILVSAVAFSDYWPWSIAALILTLGTIVIFYMFAFHEWYNLDLD
jgi:hypothetical protein